MAEYIEREAAKRAIMSQYLSMANKTKYADVIDAVPAADVVPVRHAIWRYKTMTVPGGRGQTYAKWSCTACKAKQKERSDYCPNCGADMREVEYD